MGLKKHVEKVKGFIFLSSFGGGEEYMDKENYEMNTGTFCFSD